MTVSIESLCPYCGVGCQVRYHLKNNKISWAEGINGPANRGRLCLKGRFGWDYVYDQSRLSSPLIRRSDVPKMVNPNNPAEQFREASWDEALGIAAQRFLEIKEKYGADTLGGFGSAKASNEDGYLFQKFIRSGFGTNSVDHCARLCHSSSVVALIDQIGSGGVTAAFTQCENSDVLLVVGSNPARNHPVAASIFFQAVKRGAKLIVIDPRHSEMSKYADIVIAPNPGADISLLNSILHVIIKSKLYDKDFINARTKNFDELCISTESFTPESVAELVGVSEEVIKTTAQIIGNAKAMMIYWGMGVTQHVHGVKNIRCLVNLALATGNVGKPGAGLHPLRGQNNVQGACDMGLLPNFLPGYGKAADAIQRQRFENVWQATLPDKPGLTMVEMINSATTENIKGLYFMGENPAMSDPNSSHVKQALCKLDHLVVQDLFLTETAQYADVVLPATSLLEKWGSFTNTNRQIQLSRPVIDAIEDTREDWWITQELAKRFGLQWNYQHPQEIWEEIRNLWPAVKGITWARLEKDGWCQYPCNAEDQIGKDVLFNDHFPTEDGLAKFVTVMAETPSELTDLKYPYVLITGRLLEHWHTGVMTRRSEYLKDVKSEAHVYLNQSDMEKLGLVEDDMITVSSRRGSITMHAKQDEGLSEGSVFMPFCYTEAAANMLTIDALDPQSKIPEYKYCAININKAPIN